MSSKKTLIWAVVLVALAAFYYVYEIQGGKKRREATRQQELLVRFAVEEATGLTVKRPSETVIAVKRQGHWHLTAPLSAPGDDRKYRELVRYLAELRYQRLVVEQPESLDPFGLTEPALEIHLRLKEQTQPLIVRLGTRNPTGSGYYTQVEGRAAVYLVTTVAKDTLDASLYDLRDKTVLTFELTDVQEVRMSSDTAAPIVLQRQDDGWQMTAPISAHGDNAQVRALLQRLREMKVQKFVAETPASLAPYGLETPRLRITLSEEPAGDTQESRQHTLLIGDDAPDQQGTYVRLTTRPTVYLVERSKAQRIVDTTAFDLRNKRILAFATDSVRKIHLQYPASAFTLERHDDSWKLSEPRKQTIQQRWKVDNLLYDLNTLEYAKIVTETGDDAGYGLDAPQVRITLWQEDGTSIGPLAIGQPADSAGTDTRLVYARAGSDTPLYAIKATFLDNLPKTPADLIAEK